MRRAAALNARYPIENPEPDPEAAFSRQNYVGTLGGPLKRDRLWFFCIVPIRITKMPPSPTAPPAPGSSTRLAQLAAHGLIPGVELASSAGQRAHSLSRLYWHRFVSIGRNRQNRQWYLRGSVDGYTTHNNLVQQATLPSTGLSPTTTT